MVVRFIVLVALLAIAVTDGRSVRAATEPLAPCHTRVTTIDAQGRRVVTYTDETDDTDLATAIGDAVAELNADLLKVRLVPAADGDVTISVASTGSAGRTTLTCVGPTGTAAIVINTAYLDVRASAATRGLVVMHEFGHALGLAHSPQPCALMHANNIDCARPDLISFTEAERRAIDAIYATAPVTARPSSAEPQSTMERRHTMALLALFPAPRPRARSR